MINQTTRKGIIIRPMHDRTEGNEQFPNIKCRKCELSILDYPFYKTAFEKYYHIICAIIVGSLSIEEVEFVIRSLKKQSDINLETANSLFDTISQYEKEVKLVNLH